MRIERGDLVKVRLKIQYSPKGSNKKKTDFVKRYVDAVVSYTYSNNATDGRGMAKVLLLEAPPRDRWKRVRHVPISVIYKKDKR